MPPSITLKSTSNKLQSSSTQIAKRTSPVKALHNITPVSQSGKVSTTTGNSAGQTSHTEHCKGQIPANPQIPNDRNQRVRVKPSKFQPEVNHVIVKTKSHDPVKVGGDYREHSTPSPPSSAKPSRPSSAQRFRRMVIQCRDDS